MLSWSGDKARRKPGKTESSFIPCPNSISNYIRADSLCACATEYTPREEQSSSISRHGTLILSKIARDRLETYSHLE